MGRLILLGATSRLPASFLFRLRRLLHPFRRQLVEQRAHLHRAGDRGVVLERRRTPD